MSIPTVVRILYLMSLSENKPVEYEVKVWIGRDDARIFPTPANQSNILMALLRFKFALGNNCYFNICDVSCKFLDITLEFDNPQKPLKMRIAVMDSDVARLDTKHLLEGAVYLAGEATIDESLPDGGFTDKRWIHCNQITHIDFTKLYWESHDLYWISHDRKDEKRFTLLSVEPFDYAAFKISGEQPFDYAAFKDCPI